MFNLKIVYFLANNWQGVITSAVPDTGSPGLSLSVQDWFFVLGSHDWGWPRQTADRIPAI